MAPSTKPARVDGRTARGRRTRARLVDAVLEMVTRGERRLTAPNIAAEAGVSIRSLFQHFPDLEKLWIAAADRTLELILPLVHELPGEGPFDTRLEAFSKQRIAVLEAITPMRRAAGILAPYSEEMNVRLENARHIGRREVDQVFAPELAALDDASRAEARDLLEVVASWPSWEHMRRGMSLDLDVAHARLQRLIHDILATR